MSNNCKIDSVFSSSFGDLSNDQGSSLALYSDHCRIISNKNFKLIAGDVEKATNDQSPELTSYIELKGGETGDNEQKNGNIIIKPGSDKHIYLGAHDAEEPGVLGDTLFDLLDRLITALLNTVITTPAGPAGPMSSSTLGTDIANIQTELENIKSSLVKIK